MSELVKPQGYTNMNHISQTENIDSRYHLRIFQQFPHQTLGALNGKCHLKESGRLMPDYKYDLKDLKILTFKVIFLCQKLVQSF